MSGDRAGPDERRYWRLTRVIEDAWIEECRSCGCAVVSLRTCLACGEPIDQSPTAVVDPDRLDRAARAACAAYLDLLLNLSAKAKDECQFDNCTEEGREVWRAFAERVLTAAELGVRVPDTENED